MTKLTDTQAIILSAASQRDGHIALPLPDSLRGGAATKVVGAMLAKNFLEEVEADMRNDEPVWRETGDGHGVTLVATDAGVAAIGIEPENANPAPAGATDAPTEEPAPDTPNETDKPDNSGRMSCPTERSGALKVPHSYFGPFTGYLKNLE